MLTNDEKWPMAIPRWWDNWVRVSRRRAIGSSRDFVIVQIWYLIERMNTFQAY